MRLKHLLLRLSFGIVLLVSLTWLGFSLKSILLFSSTIGTMVKTEAVVKKVEIKNGAKLVIRYRKLAGNKTVYAHFSVPKSKSGYPAVNDTMTVLCSSRVESFVVPTWTTYYPFLSSLFYSFCGLILASVSLLLLAKPTPGSEQ